MMSRIFQNVSPVRNYLNDLHPLTTLKTLAAKASWPDLRVARPSRFGVVPRLSDEAMMEMYYILSRRRGRAAWFGGEPSDEARQFVTLPGGWRRDEEFPDEPER
jgi:hypothetical protein